MLGTSLWCKRFFHGLPVDKFAGIDTEMNGQGREIGLITHRTANRGLVLRIGRRGSVKAGCIHNNSLHGGDKM